MTDTALLKKKISSRGLKKTFVAEYIGTSRQNLWKKMNNKAYFNQLEIERICKLLEIKTRTERDAIFFK